LEYRAQQLSQQENGFTAKDEEIARQRGEMERLRADAQAKIGQLQERIKELNQKLMSSTGQQPGLRR
jgi:chromosome segregation ATPase